MNILEIKIQGQEAEWKNPCTIVSGSQKYIYMKPTFDKIWEGLSIKFLFSDRNGNEKWNVLEPVETPEGVQSLVRVPADIIVPPYFNIGVMGYGTDNQFIPAAGIRIEVIDNGYNALSRINGVSDEERETLGEVVLREYKACMDGYEKEMEEFRNVMAEYAGAEAIRIAEEEARIQNEKARASQEAAREAFEENRVADEGDRMNAERLRSENEEHRRQTEAERVLEENMRQDAETIRATNEAARVRAENERAISESGRDNAEELRGSAELNRVANENERKASEEVRANAEALRAGAEEERSSAEKARNTEENKRAQNENERINAFGSLRGRLDSAVLEAEATNERAGEALVRANEAASLAEAASEEARTSGAEAKAIAENAGKEAKAIAENAGAEAKTIAETSGAEAKAIAETAGEKANAAAENANDAVRSLEGIKGALSNALKGTVYGSRVALTDVSPVEHTMAVKVRSKNLYPHSAKRWFGENTTVLSNTDNEAVVKGKDGADGNAHSSGWFRFYRNSESNPTTIDFDKDTFVTVSVEVTLIEEGIYGATFVLAPRTLTGGVKFTATTTPTRFSFTAKASDIKDVYVALNANTLKIANVQFEYGTEATEYTPYMEDVSSIDIGIIDADGNYYEVPQPAEITSSYPTMTIMAMNTGATVDVSYNRDINKAFSELEEKLTQAIISLGGNV